MKRITLVLMIVLLLTSCAPELTGAQIKVPPSAYCGLDETGWLIRDETLLQWNEDALDFLPLCRREGCVHQDRSCLAYVPKCEGQDDRGVCLHNGRLYFIAATEDGAPAIYSADPQTLERRLEYKLPQAPKLTGVTNAGARYEFLDDCVLILIEADYDPDASFESIPEESRVQQLKLLDLSTGELTEIRSDALLENCDGCYNRCYQFQMIDGVLYCELNVPVWNEDPKNPYRIIQYELLRLEPSSGRDKRTPLGKAGEEYIGFTVTVSKLLYVQPGGDFVELDLDSGKKKLIDCPVENASYADYDDRWILLESDAPVDVSGNWEPEEPVVWYFFDRDYQLADQIALPFRYQKLCPLNRCTGTRIFFQDMETNQLAGYLDKTMIGSGKLELIPMGRDHT